MSRAYFQSRILNLVYHRIFMRRLHIQTRIGCVRAFSNFVCVYDYYPVHAIKRVFRLSFDSDDSSCREGAISLLFKISDKFSYFVILAEFTRCHRKDEFVRLCRGKVIGRFGNRDPVVCPKVREMLHSRDHNFKAIALIILRHAVGKWSESILANVRNLSLSNDSIVSFEAKLGMKSYKNFVEKQR